jgi:hypothetical protein
MTLNPRWRKILRIVSIAVLILIASLTAFVQFQQHLLRWRAEHLLADIRDLQLGKSTWPDAQKIMTRWGAWGEYRGSCTSERCSYRIELDESYGAFSYATHRQNSPGDFLVECCRRLYPIYFVLGGRSAAVLARVDIIDGHIWAKDYLMAVDVLTQVLPEQDGYMLFSSGTTVWRSEDFRRQLNARHPEYVIGRPGGCEGCEAIYARYTPFADPSEVNRLLNFNLNCLTRLIPCRHRGDIMPANAKLMSDEEARLDAKLQTERNPADSCFSDPEFLGRDRANVVTARVVSVTPQRSEFGEVQVQLRLIERLKNGTFWRDGSTRSANLPSIVAGSSSNDMRPPQPGEDLLLAIPSAFPGQPMNVVNVAPCDAIPLSSENLRATQRGIALDIVPETGRDIW